SAADMSIPPLLVALAGSFVLMSCRPRLPGGEQPDQGLRNRFAITVGPLGGVPQPWQYHLAGSGNLEHRIDFPQDGRPVGKIAVVDRRVLQPKYFACPDHQLAVLLAGTPESNIVAKALAMHRGQQNGIFRYSRSRGSSKDSRLGAHHGVRRKEHMLR